MTYYKVNLTEIKMKKLTQHLFLRILCVFQGNVFNFKDCFVLLLLLRTVLILQHD